MTSLSTFDTDDWDQLFHDAVKIVIKYDKVSSSLLMRRLAIGYARAARLMDQLEAAGVIGPQDGSKPRDVLVFSMDQVKIEKKPTVVKPTEADLVSEIIRLKRRVSQIEDFLLSFPTIDDYIEEAPYQEDPELLEKAMKGILKYKKVSASLLQRLLSVGYARAARLVDYLENKGVISEQSEEGARKVLISDYEKAMEKLKSEA